MDMHKIHGQGFAVTDIPSVFDYCDLAMKDYLLRNYRSLIEEDLTLCDCFEDVCGRRTKG
jgi:hypothetical protein